MSEKLFLFEHNPAAPLLTGKGQGACLAAEGLCEVFWWDFDYCYCYFELFLLESHAIWPCESSWQYIFPRAFIFLVTQGYHSERRNCDVWYSEQTYNIRRALQHQRSLSSFTIQVLLSCSCVAPVLPCIDTRTITKLCVTLLSNPTHW